MKSRAVRLTLFLLFVIALGATAYLFWLGETRMRVESEAARAFDARVLATIRNIDQLRSAQQAYVAAGQGDQFWANKAATILADVRTSLDGLRASSLSPDGVALIDNAIAILQDFERMDRRARDYARSGQRLLASDIIYSDGLELTAAAATAVQRAGLAERELYDTTTDGVRGRQLYAMGSAGAASILVVLLLLPAGRPADEIVIVPAVEHKPASDISLRPAPAPVENAEDGWEPARVAAAAPAAPPAAPAAPAVASTSEAPPARGSAVELASLATVCTELARLSDTRELPGILERAANTLKASGIVLWIADPDGRELSPIVTHGYPAAIVTRLGRILRDDRNATAAAFRTGLLQTVHGDDISSGAIAAPLVTPEACVGVMAAEVRDEGEQDPSKLAAATIVAAQLATLVGPPAAKNKAEATG